jgi:hypothetical protein
MIRRTSTIATVIPADIVVIRASIERRYAAGLRLVRNKVSRARASDRLADGRVKSIGKWMDCDRNGDNARYVSHQSLSGALLSSTGMQ